MYIFIHSSSADEDSVKLLLSPLSSLFPLLSSLLLSPPLAPSSVSLSPVSVSSVSSSSVGGGGGGGGVDSHPSADGFSRQGSDTNACGVVFVHSGKLGFSIHGSDGVGSVTLSLPPPNCSFVGGNRPVSLSPGNGATLGGLSMQT